MTAPADNYFIASGATLYAGCAAPDAGIPPWVPAPGTVADISLNTLFDVKGTITNSIAITRTWSGVAYAPWWGAYGTLVGGGGGHSDGNQNFLMQYDIQSRLFSILKPSCPVFHADADNYVADVTTGWMFGDTVGGSLQVGEPFTGHFYAYQIALPPSALAGAPNGWLFTPGRTSMAEGAQRATKQSHKFALGMGAGTKWSMHGSPLSREPSHGASIYDSLRNRVVAFSDSQASSTKLHPYIDIATGNQNTLNVDTAVTGNYVVGAYHVAGDCYMLARYISGALSFKVIDAVTLVVTSPVPSGTAPVETAEGAWDWVEAWQAWVYYPGSGNNIYTLKCSGDPRGNNWAWAKQTVTGTANSYVIGGGGGLPYNRLRYCAPLGIMVWFADYLVPVQGFNISAP
jgi:hypothetical protein